MDKLLKIIEYIAWLPYKSWTGGYILGLINGFLVFGWLIIILTLIGVL